MTVTFGIFKKAQTSLQFLEVVTAQILVTSDIHILL